MTKIKLENIEKKYKNADTLSVKNFNLEINKGEFVVLVGPSGCGKSTTLRMIAGLEDITSGKLLIDGKLANEKSPKNRDIAMVFQSYALYPHMSVRENIGYGLKLRGTSKEERVRKIIEAANYLGLEEYLERQPKDLSGGQRQRVALARTLVRNAEIYLMDEPLSNLDAKLRATMRAEISRIHRMKGGITIYVTHDQVEAMTMADRIVVMNNGEIQQIGTPEELYRWPVNIFVAQFLGQPSMNIFDCYYADGYAYTLNFASEYTKANETKLTDELYKTQGFKVKVTDSDREILEAAGYNKKQIKLGIRAKDIKGDQKYFDEHPEAVVDILPFNIEYLGDETLIYYKHEEHGILYIAKVNNQTKARLDIPHQLVFNPKKLYFFDVDTEEAINTTNN